MPPEPPAAFGDDWSTPLEVDDVKKLKTYFDRVQHLRHSLGYVNFRVGGRDHILDIEPRHQRGITFATPRQSLMAAVGWNAFDDILIGNFCKTTLHGDWGGRVGNDALYPEFSPFVTKFGDNGCAWSPDELRAYFAEYMRRGFMAFGPGPSDQAMERELQPYL